MPSVADGVTGAFKLNPVGAAWTVLGALRRRRPKPSGNATVDHRGFAPVLLAVSSGGIRALRAVRPDLDEYRRHLHRVRPDDLSRDEALAYWINLNNAEAIALAAEADDAGLESIISLPNAFGRTVATVDGERMSLAAIEHGKVRRFGDPRIHAALVCGALSCPTLRREPFTGAGIDRQLEEQMTAFLAAGGAVVSGNELRLSRVFLWYGADFVRAPQMPSFLPVSRRRIARALAPWLDPAGRALVADGEPVVTFQPYDWGLGCSVG